MQRKYTWKPGFPAPKIEASVFGGILDHLDEEGVAVTPGVIVETARDPRSPIHEMFLWDDREAAEQHREQQARRFVAGLTVVRVQIEDGPSLGVREWYSMKATPDSSGRQYMPREKILGSRDLRVQLIGSAKKDLEALVVKFAGVLASSAAMPRLNEALDLLRDEIDGLAHEAGRRRSPAAAGAGEQAEERPQA